MQLVGNFLSAREVVNLNEGVIDELKVDPLPLQPGGQPVVAVHAELQAERGPGGHAQMAESELRVDEIEVVVQTPAAVGLQEGLAGGFVVPRFERGAALHRAEDVHESGLASPFGEDLLDAVLLAKGIDVTDELDLQPVLLRHGFGVLPDLVPQGLGELREVEDSHLAPVELPGERPGMSDVRERSHDEDPVKARKHAAKAVRVSIDERGHGVSGWRSGARVPPQFPLPTRPSSSPCLVPACPG